MAKTTQHSEDRSKWTLAEHCDHANAQLILNDTNEGRRAKGLGPVKWFVRNGRVVCDWVTSA